MSFLLSWEVFGAVLLTLVGIAMPIMGDQFRIAKACLVLAAVLMLAKLLAWAARDEVSLPFASAAVIVCVAVEGVLLHWGFGQIDTQELTVSKRLKHGDKPMPRLPKGVEMRPDALAVVFGGNVSIVNRMPHTVLATPTEKLLEIDRGPRRAIAVKQLTVYDEKGEMIAHIDPDEFWVRNTNRSKRPDASTLKVYDQKNEEVLSLEYLNTRALAVTGVLRRKDGSLYGTLTNDALILPPNIHLVGNVMVDSGGADVMVG